MHVHLVFCDDCRRWSIGQKARYRGRLDIAAFQQLPSDMSFYPSQKAFQQLPSEDSNERLNQKVCHLEAQDNIQVLLPAMTPAVSVTHAPALPRPAPPRPALPVLPFPALPCPVLSCPVTLPCPALPCPAHYLSLAPQAVLKSIHEHASNRQFSLQSRPCCTFFLFFCFCAGHSP